MSSKCIAVVNLTNQICQLHYIALQTNWNESTKWLNGILMLTRRKIYDKNNQHFKIFQSETLDGDDLNWISVKYERRNCLKLITEFVVMFFDCIVLQFVRQCCSDSSTYFTNESFDSNKNNRFASFDYRLDLKLSISGQTAAAFVHEMWDCVIWMCLFLHEFESLSKGMNVRSYHFSISKLYLTVLIWRSTWYLESYHCSLLLN